MKAVMYHYVRPADHALPYLRHLALDDFRRQLDHFAATDRLIGRDEFLAMLDGAPVPDDGILLTFDDGLIDHHRHVLPELEARGCVGLFFVPTQPLLPQGRALDVHRVHRLLGRLGGAAPLAVLTGMLDERLLTNAHVAEFRTRTYVHQDNDGATTEFKRILNYYVDPAARGALLDALAAHFDEPDPVPDLYMDAAAVADLVRRGMVVGSHTVGHPVLSTLDEAGQRREILDSFATLEAITGPLEPRVFCYPYGGFHTFTATTEALLDEAGCRCSFNVEPRDLCEADLRERPQALPRFDCNVFPHGRAYPDRAPAPAP